jgi:hypothetical protein
VACSKICSCVIAFPRFVGTRYSWFAFSIPLHANAVRSVRAPEAESEHPSATLKGGHVMVANIVKNPVEAHARPCC